MIATLPTLSLAAFWKHAIQRHLRLAMEAHRNAEKFHNPAFEADAARNLDTAAQIENAMAHGLVAPVLEKRNIRDLE